MSMKPTYEELQKRLKDLENVECACKQAEDALLESERKYRNLFENSVVGMCISNAAGRIMVMNESFRRITGYSLNDLSLIHMKDLYVNADDRKRLFDFIERDHIVEGFEVQFKRKSLEPYWVSLWSRPIVYDGKDAALTSIVDITLRKRIEQENVELQKHLLNAQKMDALGALAGGIAHDFNDLLTPILGYSELVMKALPLDSPLREKVKDIFQAGERARDLVQKILAFSRPSEGVVKTITVQDSIQEALGLLRHTLPATIAIMDESNPTCRPINADPDHIRQIIMNLATNAFHAMEKNGGILTIGLDEIEVDRNSESPSPGTYLLLSVKDTGEGIPDEIMDKIFNPYFTTREKNKGMGLGLSVVHGLVKKMQGNIQVTSESGAGSTFRVYLPLTKTNVERDIVIIAKDIRETNKCILLVDDDPDVVNVLKAMLEDLGYRVTTRTNSYDALEAFRDNPRQYDLVLTDMSMPIMTGVELSEMIMRIRPDIPIILCTGFSDRIDETKAKSLGIKGVLVKPVLKERIAALIREVLAGAA